MTALRSRPLRLAGGRTVEVFEGGTGPPLVYLHPASGVSADDPFAVALAGHFTVHAPVAPGFNDLAELDDIRDVHDMALVFDDVVVALGLGSVPVVGHSFGAMFAAELAAHVPDRVSSLVLVSPIGLWRDDVPVLDIFATPPLQLQRCMWADPESDVARNAFGTAQPATPEEMAERIIRIVQGLVTAGKFMMPIPDRGLRRRLYRVSMPTLLVWGADDRIVPVAYADDFVALLPDATTLVLDGAGHMVTLERTAEVVAAVRAHLSDVGTGPSGSGHAIAGH